MSLLGRICYRPLTAFRVKELKLIIARKRVIAKLNSLGVRPGDKIGIRLYSLKQKKSIEVIGYFYRYSESAIWFIEPVMINDDWFGFLLIEYINPKLIRKL
jgi:hypothetical protein